MSQTGFKRVWYGVHMANIIKSHLIPLSGISIMSCKINISCLIIRIFMFNELLNFTLNFIKTLILTCFPGVLLAIRRNLFELGWHMYLCWVNHRFLCQKVTFPGIPWTLSLRTDILIGQSIHVVIYNSYKSTWYRNMISEYEIKILKFHFLCQSLFAMVLHLGSRIQFELFCSMLNLDDMMPCWKCQFMWSQQIEPVHMLNLFIKLFI